MLKTFADQDKCHMATSWTGKDCDVADTFPTFAEQLGTDGFTFLYQRVKNGLSNGPILVTVEDRRVVEAIAPLGILPDVKTRTQPPQYFSVHPHYRHRGHGKALWRAAMAGGAEDGAEYKVLQAAAGAQQSCSIFLKACPRSGSHVAGTCRSHVGKRHNSPRRHRSGKIGFGELDIIRRVAFGVVVAVLITPLWG